MNVVNKQLLPESLLESPSPCAGDLPAGEGLNAGLAGDAGMRRRWALAAFGAHPSGTAPRIAWHAGHLSLPREAGAQACVAAAIASQGCSAAPSLGSCERPLVPGPWETNTQQTSPPPPPAVLSQHLGLSIQSNLWMQPTLPQHFGKAVPFLMPRTTVEISP